MTTTTIRVDIATHERLLELSRARHATLGDTVRDAAESLHRQQFAQNVVEQLGVLRSDPDAWNDYLTDASSSSVADGIG